MMKLPDINIEPYRSVLVHMVAETSWLAHPETVQKFGCAVFPTVRARKGDLRGGRIESGMGDGMYDDNTTPRWALLWAHGIPATHHPSCRTFAHVWESADDIKSYCHLANIVMVPEPFAGLTDKSGPLTSYLRWHAWSVYNWKPSHEAMPEKPADFDGVRWRYFPKIDDPKTFIRARIAALRNGRIRTLRPIMERLGML